MIDLRWGLGCLDEGGAVTVWWILEGASNTAMNAESCGLRPGFSSHASGVGAAYLTTGAVVPAEGPVEGDTAAAANRGNAVVSGCTHVSRKERIDDRRRGHARQPDKNCTEDTSGHAGKRSAADHRSKSFFLTVNALSTPQMPTAGHRCCRLMGLPSDLKGLVRGSTGPWRREEH